MPRKSKTALEFVSLAKAVHGDKYDYSKVVYTKSSEKVIIICPEHGEFTQTPNSHLSGCGCRDCFVVRKTKDVSTFISLAKAVHGDKYDYSLSIYRGAIQPITIICPEHGEFTQIANNHVSVGCGCKECAGNLKSNTDEFIISATNLHKGKYNYNLVNYVNSLQKVIIICPEHGEFTQIPGNHLAESGCPKCAKSGFNPDKPSVMYVYTFGRYAGFGITNNFRERHKTHLKSFADYGETPKLLATYNMSGKLAQLLERHIKKTMDITNTGITGFKTEAVHIDDLPRLLSTIDSHICA